ncbi:DUF1003 domain-containing protein [Candidatus Peregrinibacteria bacterium]|nr:DUF1003 domain-containing protein [Candidatus Peregrinibacteria bacterium]
MSFIRKLLSNGQELHKDLAKVHRQSIKSFKAKMNLNRKLSDRIADFLTDSFGTVLFLSFNVLWFGLWILINTGSIPGIPVFDPFPFGLLTMIVSLEAIFLAIIVLISQNRAAQIGDLREEIDLQINVRAEAEITKILIILDRIHDHLGLPSEDDAELILMKQKTDLNQIEKELTREML